MTSDANSPRPRSGTASSIHSATRSIRSASGRLMDANIPLGMWAATAVATSQAPTIGEIRRGSFGTEGWDPRVQQAYGQTTVQTQQQQMPGTRRPSSAILGRLGSFGRSPPLPEEKTEVPDDDGKEPFPDMSKKEMQSVPATARDMEKSDEAQPKTSSSSSGRAGYKSTATENITRTESRISPVIRQGTLPNGYIAPPKVPWTESTMIGLKAFWKWFLTPMGFLITLYGLNVVAWGGMLFLVLLNAAPAMCSPNLPRNNFDGCNDIDSPRRIWIEIDSQILNALFCVTGLGLIPWRFRDLYYLLRFRLTSERRAGRAAKMYGLRKLAGIHAGWFRLPGSDTIDEISPSAYRSSTAGAAQEPDDDDADDERLPLPTTKTPALPLTGVRSRPTRLWVLDFVIWCNVWNTFFQCCLCGFMWGLNRYDRPSWSTGLFVALACIIAGVGGVTMFLQGKRVKRVEGVRPEGGDGDVEAGAAAAR